MLPILSQPQPFLTRQNAVHPAFFVAAGGVEGGQGLRQLPEAGVLADAVFDEEAFEQFAALGAEEDHRLVQPIQCGRARWRALEFAPDGVRIPLGLGRFFEQRLLLDFLFLAFTRRGFGLLAEEPPRAFRDGESTATWPSAGRPAIEVKTVTVNLG